MRGLPPALRTGFTLVELMIVVTILSILAMVAVPKFADMVRKSKEGKLKGNLGSLRSALSIYYGDQEGFYPSGRLNSQETNSNVLNASLVPRYLGAMPSSEPANYHNSQTKVYLHQGPSVLNHSHDNYGWQYDGYVPNDNEWGQVFIGCSHTDTKGNQWTTY